MPGRSGVELLTALKERCPQVTRLLTTAYSDLSSAISAVNSGAIYAYVTKPWKIDELRLVIRQALQVHHLLCERDALMAEKISVFQRLLLLDLTRGMGLAVAGFAGQVRRPLAAATTWLQHRQNVFLLSERDKKAADAHDLWPQVLDQTRTITQLADHLGTWLASQRGTESTTDMAEVLLEAATDVAETQRALERDVSNLTIERQLLTAGFKQLFFLVKALLPATASATVHVSVGPGKAPIDIRIHGGTESHTDYDRLGLAAYLAIYHPGGVITIPTWSPEAGEMTVRFEQASDDGLEHFLAHIAAIEP
jgi:CheY-like chemotaxis protein